MCSVVQVGGKSRNKHTVLWVATKLVLRTSVSYAFSVATVAAFVTPSSMIISMLHRGYKISVKYNPMKKKVVIVLCYAR